jgi:polyisoprenoid-binding protein YceI
MENYSLYKKVQLYLHTVRSNIKSKNPIMKKFFYPGAAIALITASAFTFIAAQSWKVSEGYSVKFTGEGGKIQGVFTGLKAVVNFDEKDLATSGFEASVDVSTFNTGNGMMNTHAKSEQWFDAEKNPTVSFKSSSIAKTATGYEAKGKLSMHGISKDFTIPFTFEKTATGGLFKSTFEVNRLAYEINTAQPERGGSVFPVELSIPVTK